MRLKVLLASVGLGGCQAATGVSPAAPPAASILTLDECSGLPGYSAFRSRLEAVAAARDGVALRALFHPQGSMRVNGIGGNAATPDWGFARPHAATVWPELEQILALGCVRRGDRLLLPAMAALADDGTVAPEQEIALEAFALRSEPDPGATALRWVDPGEPVLLISSGEPEGWAKLQIDGVEGFGRTESLRSPHGFQLVIVPFDGGWRIREFAGGI